MLTPIGKRLLIKPVEQKHGILFLTHQKPTQFQIVAIGDQVTKVKLGDIIYLETYCGAELEHENEKYLVVNEDSILAKLD